MVPKLSENKSRMLIPDPDFSPSRIQGSIKAQKAHKNGSRYICQTKPINNIFVLCIIITLLLYIGELWYKKFVYKMFIKVPLYS